MGSDRNNTATEVFAAFLKLGLTSFGGPVAHLGYFRQEIVERRGWVDDRAYGDLVALSQFLPGPSSSQVGIALGTVRAVYDFGAGPVLEIAGDRCGVVMVPFTRAVVPEVDVAGGRLVIDPPAGLLDAPEDGAEGAPAGKDEA